MKALLTLTITFLLLFALSLLLDTRFISSNWMRYVLVVLMALLILGLGAKIAWQQLKDLKDKIN